MKRKKGYFYVLGLVVGVLNGLFGSGGGTVVVPMLEAADMESRQCHATSIAIILPLSFLSALFYFNCTDFNWGTTLCYLPFGMVGAIIGATCLNKVSNNLLRRIFGGVIILSAVRLWLK
ncbi:MAG: sulfite exporter TauE/SafE family protein [Oscillospiraceae bacterium]